MSRFEESHDLVPDLDPAETQEWIESLDAVLDRRGPGRARFIVRKLLKHSEAREIGLPAAVTTPYINTIAPEDEPWFPGDEYLERRLRAYTRWNAAVMVSNANKHADGIGGHLSSFASSAALYDVGFNWFWHGKDNGEPGDHIYFQGHAAPGIYARAFLEGRLAESDLDHFRREIGRQGLSSYPHPRLMPDFWEYPTVSMGLGPINAIYQARFNRYLHDRRIDDTSASKVWCFMGDGESDEPESLGALHLASRERLDNLIFVVNCNLQRLDGPVRGNGKIIQELEGVFRGAGWNVIKVVWGSRWDGLLQRDVDGVLVEKMNTTVDGEYQRYSVESGSYIREQFFGPDPRLRDIVSDLSDDELRTLPRGGHDYKKIFAAYKRAVEHRGSPTVILVKTIKGWTLGPDVEGRNATHQIKKLTKEQLLRVRDRLYLQAEVPEDFDPDDPPYITLAPESPEYRYLMDRRRALGGSLPSRTTRVRRPLVMPTRKPFQELSGGSGTQAVSTTMAFTRLLRSMLREEKFGSRVVPIIPDEARTFGMDALFKEIGIYASAGQRYEPVDWNLQLSYREAKDGQLLEEGITEAGSLSSFTAAATSYATRGVPMVPFYIFYSMFGFQRVGDLLWALGDSRGRGFLMGATAGRTTLLGEGLQHQDGHSPVLASTVPPCRVYDPAFAYELAAIIEDGLQVMYGGDPEKSPWDGGNLDVFYYLTLYNENYVQPPMAPDVDREGLLRGLYRWKAAPEADWKHRATLLFSGPAWRLAQAAADDLAEHYNVGTELWSATSFKRLRDNALGVERWNRLHPLDAPRTAYVTERLSETLGPVVAVTDFMRAVPDQIARFVPGDFTVLGTDGFGRSDTREALRRHFEIDHAHIVVAVLSQLALRGEVKPEAVADAIARYGIDPDKPDPWEPRAH
ncbi:MAG: pyruvate dehydrogenase (acetyl-transferring), homodimeric type [Acidimicrobiales bacterium]|nr:pyruvate dehydrogenase (acetyl-transferring), homodimeric type [Acidimicrobiales bacterium]